MISRIAGRLEEVATDHVLLETEAGIWYELLVPACDVERHSRRIGQPTVLYTIHYIEGDPSRGAIVPRLVAFLDEQDREFFRAFTTVKGVGTRKALRALKAPASQVAAAIQNKDAKLLKSLPEIGQRMAERIIAELHDKVAEFAGQVQPGPAAAELSAPATEAISVLVQLGERQADATALVQRVMDVAPDLDLPEQIIQKAYKLKAGA
ncbi:MAG: Holliday junction branch migration protein RuvA [Phycisphaerae bacterium]